VYDKISKVTLLIEGTMPDGQTWKREYELRPNADGVITGKVDVSQTEPEQESLSFVFPQERSRTDATIEISGRDIMLDIAEIH
jgi:hypothetical protein